MVWFRVWSTRVVLEGLGFRVWGSGSLPELIFVRELYPDEVLRSKPPTNVSWGEIFIRVIFYIRVGFLN